MSKHFLKIYEIFATQNKKNLKFQKMSENEKVFKNEKMQKKF